MCIEYISTGHKRHYVLFKTLFRLKEFINKKLILGGHGTVLLKKRNRYSVRNRSCNYCPQTTCNLSKMRFDVQYKYLKKLKKNKIRQLHPKYYLMNLFIYFFHRLYCCLYLNLKRCPVCFCFGNFHCCLYWKHSRLNYFFRD